MQVKSKNYCMIMRTEGSGAILTAHEIPDMVIREGFPKALPKKLHVTLLQTERLHRLSSLRVSIPMAGNMFFIVSQSQKISHIVILQFHHTPISPIAGTSNPAAFTLTARDFNPVEPSLFCVGRNLRDIRSTNATLAQLQMMNTIRNYLHICLAVLRGANSKSLQGMKTGYKITLSVLGWSGGVSGNQYIKIVLVPTTLQFSASDVNVFCWQPYRTKYHQQHHQASWHNQKYYHPREGQAGQELRDQTQVQGQKPAKH